MHSIKGKQKELSKVKPTTKKSKQSRINLKTPENKDTRGKNLDEEQEGKLYSKLVEAGAINRETLTQCSEEIEKLKKEMVVMRNEVNKRMKELNEKEEELFKREHDVNKRNKRIDGLISITILYLKSL